MNSSSQRGSPLRRLHHRLPWLLPLATAVSAAGTVPAAPPADAPPARFEYTAPRMGTLFRVVLFASDETAARVAAAAAFARVAELNRIMSDYDPDSEVMRLTRQPAGTPVAASADLFAVLQLGQQCAAISGGAFDVTAGPAVRLWRESRRTHRLPSEAERGAALRAAGHDKLRLNATDRTVTLLAPGMLLDLGGIAKGYAADEALAVLARLGFPRAMVAAGGDLALGEAPPGAPGWRIEIAPFGQSMSDPLVLVAAHAGISTSGGSEQFVEIGGVRYSHIVNPATALGLTQPVAVTIIARDATRADSLATACSVIAADRPEQLTRCVGDTARAIVFRRDDCGNIKRTICGASPPGLHTLL
jgi:thiamine biosynthesis lipoprotein